MSEYIYISAETERQLKRIRRSIYLKMNGVTADRMVSDGVAYAKNYGVSLPELKQMAGKIPHDKALAEALWRDKVRETMLLATFVYPVEEFDEDRAAAWVTDVMTLELAENLSRNLLGKIPYVGSVVEGWANSGNYWICAVGFFSAAFAVERLTHEQKKALLFKVTHDIKVYEVPVCRAIALFLRKLGGQSQEDARAVMSFLTGFAMSEARAERYVYEEVKTDLEYRFDI
jgi:Predicted DNA alkylation repair enzyme